MSETTDRISKKIAHAIVMGVGLTCIYVFAFHVGGWWGLLLVEGLVLRGKL